MAERAVRKAPLKAVAGGRAPAQPRKTTAAKAPPEINSVKSAAESGTDRDLLVQLRNRIAGDIDNPDTPSRDLAALTRRIQEIVKDLKALEVRDRGELPSAGTPDESFDPKAI